MKKIKFPKYIKYGNMIMEDKNKDGSYYHAVGTEVECSFSRRDLELRGVYLNVGTDIPPPRWGVHEMHCCFDHGCKFGDDDCPVGLGLIKQRYPCQDCDLEGEAINFQNKNNKDINKIEGVYHSTVRYEWEDVSETLKKSILEAMEKCYQEGIESGKKIKIEEIKSVLNIE